MQNIYIYIHMQKGATGVRQEKLWLGNLLQTTITLK